MSRLTPARILVVDDNDDIGEVMGEMLREMGHDVVVVTDGPAALATVERFTPHVAMIDIGLPEMDGYELVTRLRALNHLEGLMLIAVTGYGRPSDREQSRVAGFHHHLVKPIDLAALEELIGGR
jgi:CheY-like chemotaxis protein